MRNLVINTLTTEFQSVKHNSFFEKKAQKYKVKLLNSTKMHALIITPFPLQASILNHALKRNNIKNTICLPNSLNHEWHPKTDALIFPHPLKEKQWELLLKYINKLSVNIPIIFIGKMHKEFFKKQIFLKIGHKAFSIEDSLSANEISSIIKESIQNKFKPGNSKIIEMEGLKLDRERHILHYKKHSIFLTKKEFFLMELLMTNAGKIISRENIIEYVWDKRTYVSQNTIEVYICRLRRKINKYVKKTFIKTIPCLGYEFTQKEALQSAYM